MTSLGAPIPSATTAATATPTPLKSEMWEAYKEKIVDLFVNKFMSLEQIREIMAAEHGFQARSGSPLSYQHCTQPYLPANRRKHYAFQIGTVWLVSRNTRHPSSTLDPDSKGAFPANPEATLLAQDRDVPDTLPPARFCGILTPRIASF